MSIAETAGSNHKTRVISVYATKWRLKNPVVDEEFISLGQLEEFHALYEDQLPRVILRRAYSTAALGFQPKNDVERAAYGEMIPPSADGVTIRRMVSRLFVLPSDQVVATFDFEYLMLAVTVKGCPFDYTWFLPSAKGR